MRWFVDNWVRLAVVLSLLIVSVGFVSYLDDKNELAREIELMRQSQAETARADRLAQEKREYGLKRSEACLAIFKAESAKWNNVAGWNYDQESDKCGVRYKESKRKTPEECAKHWSGTAFLEERALCLEGQFVNRF